MTPTVLISRNFPPALGGTCTLYANVYRPSPPNALSVLTAPHPDAATFDPTYPHRILRRDFDVRAWTKPFEWVELGWRQLGDVRRLLRETDARELHCATTFPEGVTGLLAKRLLGVRYIQWVAGEDAECFRRFRIEGPLQRAMLRTADRVISISQNTARICRELGAHDGNLRIVLPGVDLTAFAPQPQRAAELRRRLGAEAFPLLVTVGRLHKRKGHDMVLRALPRIRERFPDAKYWIVGDSSGAPTSDAEDLRKLVAELELGDAVRFVGGVPFADLPAYYSAADLFLTPNRQIGGDVEGFGIAFLEAAACGKTSIAGRSGGAVDAVLHDETGWLVNGDDATDVADGILRVLADDALRTRLEHGALRRAHELTWDAAFANLQAALAD